MSKIHPSKLLNRTLGLPLRKHDFLITTVEGYFSKWLLNKIRWLLNVAKLCFKKYCQDACNIKDGALCNNSLHLEAVNVCCKNSILDTSRGLDLTCSKISFSNCCKGLFAT